MPLEHWNAHGPLDVWMPLPCAPRGNTPVTPNLRWSLGRATGAPEPRAEGRQRDDSPRSSSTQTQNNRVNDRHT